jgi:AbiU2
MGEINFQKKQEKLEHLKSKTWETIQVLLDTKDVFNYCKYLYEPPNTEECEFANKNIHIRAIRIFLFKQTVIELAKCLGDKTENDEHKINTYIKNLKNDGYYGDLNFPEEKIREYENDFTVVKGYVKEVIFLRDNYYAHSSVRNPNIKKNYTNHYIVSIPHLEMLIKILMKIFVDVYFYLFASDLDLSLYSETDKITILSDMVSIRKLENQKLIRNI